METYNIKGCRNNTFGGGATKQRSELEKEKRITERSKVPAIGTCVLINTEKPRIVVGEERDYEVANQDRFFGIVEKEDRNGKIYIQRYVSGKPVKGYRSQFIKPKRLFSYGLISYVVLKDLPKKEYTYEEMDISKFIKIATAYIELLPQREVVEI